MNIANDSGSKHSLDRTRIARAVFAAAESMGMADRKLIEQLAGQVMERLEQSRALSGTEQPLPGMEDLVSKSQRRHKRLPSASEIQSIVEEILASKEPAQKSEELELEKEEVKHKMEVIIVKPEAKTAGVSLSENALRVLKKRYLEKDAQGQVIETPEKMFRRVAKAVASAEFLCDGS